MDKQHVTLGVRRGHRYWKRLWRVLGPNTKLLEGEREIKLNINLPDDFFSGPTITVNIELPPDHGVKVTQEK